jgi:hypothetical protein
MDCESNADFALHLFKESINLDKDLKEFQELKIDENFPTWADILDKAQTLWQKNFQRHLEYIQNEKEIENHIENFKTEANKIFTKRGDYMNFKKYYAYIIDYQVKRIKNEMSESKENICHSIPTVRIQNMDLFKLKAKKKINAIASYNKYELVHMIRCHSKDNNIEDSETPVNDVAFELCEFSREIDRAPNYTNICATCGNNIINLIDIESGSIVNRFVDEMLHKKNKEVYNRLAWTIINGLSVLVGGGLHGHIKVILPKHSVCLSRIEAHKSQIKCLLFHYKYENILFSASDDLIKIWTIVIKEGETDMECECTYELLGVIEYGQAIENTKESVLSMCFIPNDFLVIATEKKHYSLQLNDNMLLKTNDNAQVVTDVDMSSQDAIEFLTTVPESQKNKKYKALLIEIENKSDQDKPFIDSFVANKLLFCRDTLFANLVGSTLVYALRCDYGSEHLKLKVTQCIEGGDDDSSIDTFMSIYEENKKIILIRASPGGRCYYTQFDEHLKSPCTLKYKIPEKHSIQRVNDTKKIPIKHYGLLEKPKILNCICNGNFLLFSTSQNMILIWKRQIE